MLGIKGERMKSISLLIMIVIPIFLPTATGCGFDPDEMEPSRGGTYRKVVLGGGENQMLSTPTIADIDQDEENEIVVFSSDGTLYLLDPDGEVLRNITVSGNGTEIFGSNYTDEHTPFTFGSPLVEDIMGRSYLEMVIGTRGGAVCIDTEGEIKWRSEDPEAVSYTTPCIVKAYGDAPGEDIAIATSVVYENGSTFLKLYSNQGETLSSHLLSDSSEAVTTTIVSSNVDTEEPGDEDLLVPLNGFGIKWYERRGPTSSPFDLKPAHDLVSNTMQYSSPAICNISGTGEKEIVAIMNRVNPASDLTGHSIRIYGDDGSLISYENVDNGHPVVGSPVLADLDPLSDATPSVKEELIYADRGGTLHVRDISDSPFGTTELWSFNLGGDILSSPAVYEREGDRRLCIVVANTQGEVFCFDGDPSDGIDEGISYPGDCQGQDIIWKCDTGCNITSSPVIGDLDGDGSHEVVIGGMGGEVIIIHGGGRNSRSVIDWPTLHSNNRRDGVFEPESVEVELISKEGKGPFKIKPGSTKTLNIEISARGTGDQVDDLYSISTESSDRIWLHDLDTPGYQGDPDPGFVILRKGEKTNLAITVIAPWEGEPGQVVHFNITATNERKEHVNDVISIGFQLDLFADHDMYFDKQPSSTSPLQGEKWDRLYPGNSSNYTVSIRNEGTVNDTYDLTLDEPPSGWDWYFLETGKRNVSVTLITSDMEPRIEGVSETTLTVMVKVPEDAIFGDLIPINISSHSANERLREGGVENNDTLHILVGRVTHYTMEIPPGPHTVYMGKSSDLPIEITNRGNSPIEIDLEVQPSHYFDFGYPENSLDIPVGMTKRFHIHIQAPDFYPGADPEYDFTVDAVIDGVKKVSEGFRLRLERYFMIDCSLSPKNNQTLDPGQIVHYQLDLVNRGASDEVLNITSDPYVADNEMDMYIRGESELVGFPLPLNREASLDLSLRVGNSTPAGDHTIRLHLRSGSGYRLVVEFGIVVRSRKSMDLITPDDLGRISLGMEPGDDFEGIIGVRNTGNEYLNFTAEVGKRIPGETSLLQGNDVEESVSITWLSLAGDTDGLERIAAPFNSISRADFTEDTVYYFPRGIRIIDDPIRLSSGSTLWIGYRITLPHKDGMEMVRPLDLSFLVKNHDANNFERFDIDVTPLYADLEILDTISVLDARGRERDSFSEGDPVFISLVLRNTGEVKSGGFKVKVDLDGNEIISRKLDPLDPGEELKIGFFVQPERGDHIVRIELDPENIVYELKDQFMSGSGVGSNVEEIPLTIVERETDNKGDPAFVWSVVIGSTILLLVLLSSLILFILKKRNLQ